MKLNELITRLEKIYIRYGNIDVVTSFEGDLTTQEILTAYEDDGMAIIEMRNWDQH